MKLFLQVILLFCGFILFSLFESRNAAPLEPESDSISLGVVGSAESQLSFDMSPSDKRLSEEPRLRRPLLFKRETNVRRPLLFKRNARLSPPRQRHYFQFERY